MRNGLPNQDMVAWRPVSGVGDRFVVALSDGHGGPRHFRSRLGSLVAVRAGLDRGGEFLDAFPVPGAQPAGTLAEDLVAAWERDVREALEAIPFSAEELDVLERREGPGARAAVVANPLLAYGATLIVALVCGRSGLVLQLGDGDVLVASPSGVHRPLPPDPRLFAGETTSLCMPEAWREFRSAPIAPDADEEGLLLLATDGFKNAYLDDESFLQVGPDILTRIREGGMETVAANLEGWLSDAARNSGDDVSAAVVRLA